MDEDILIDDRFEILSELGEGGFGVVYCCKDLSLERDTEVALKILRTDLTDSPEHREMFVKEVQWLYEEQDNLSCPEIVRIGHYGTHDGRPYFTMPLADRKTVQDLEGNIPSARPQARLLLARHVTQCLQRALSALHQHEKLHRDIKPANILVKSTSPTIKRAKGGLIAESDVLMLADLGLVKDLRSRTMLLPGVGTRGYMAPEAEPGVSYDPNLIGQATDLFSATMTICFCLTGRLAQGTWQSNLRELGFDDGLIEVLEKGLHPDPAKRHKSADAWGIDLLHHLPTMAGQESTSQSQRGAPRNRRKRKEPKRNRKWMAAIRTLLLRVAAATALFAMFFFGLREAVNRELIAQPFGTDQSSSSTTTSSMPPSTVTTTTTTTTTVTSQASEDDSDLPSTEEADKPQTVEASDVQLEVDKILTETGILGTATMLDSGGVQINLEGVVIENSGFIRIVESVLLELEGVVDVQTGGLQFKPDLDPILGTNLRTLLDLGPVTFSYLGADVDPSSDQAEALTAIADFLKETPDVLQVEVAGFTDGSGRNSTNLEVSEQRAEAAAGYLVANGVDATRITASGYGASCPISTDDQERNRRVEVVVIATAESSGEQVTVCATG